MISLLKYLIVFCLVNFSIAWITQVKIVEYISYIRIYELYVIFVFSLLLVYRKINLYDKIWLSLFLIFGSINPILSNHTIERVLDFSLSIREITICLIIGILFFMALSQQMVDFDEK